MNKIFDPVITAMAEEVVKLCSPFQIFLVSSKTGRDGKVNSFKICAVVDDSYTDHSQLESEILLNTDCPVPCDIIVYNISDWNECVDDDCTFAYRVDNEGELLYEQKK